MRGALAALIARARRPVSTLGVVILLTACEGGSGQSGSAFTFLTVDGFSLSGGAIVSSVPSSTSQTTTTIACVTLRNNLKNPTFTTPNTLDNVTIQSYTLSVNGRTFSFGTAVLVPAGAIPKDATGVAGNTATFAVILVPAGAKGSAGTASVAELTFRGRDGRGQSVSTDGGVTVVFEDGLAADSTCSSTTGGTGGTGSTGTGGTTP